MVDFALAAAVNPWPFAAIGASDKAAIRRAGTPTLAIIRFRIDISLSRACFPSAKVPARDSGVKRWSPRWSPRVKPRLKCPLPSLVRNVSFLLARARRSLGTALQLFGMPQAVTADIAAFARSLDDASAAVSALRAGFSTRFHHPVYPAKSNGKWSRDSSPVAPQAAVVPRSVRD